MPPVRILMILVPGDPEPTAEPALRLARVIEPYYFFRDSDAEVVLASPAGGLPWTRREDEESGLPDALSRRFRMDRSAHDAFADTLALDQVFAEDFQAAYCVGAIASIWRAEASDPVSVVIAAMLEAGKPVAIIQDGIDVKPDGAGAGLLILGHAPAAPALAARALLQAIRPR